MSSGRTTNPLFDTPQSAQSSMADMSQWRPASGAQGALEQQASPQHSCVSCAQAWMCLRRRACCLRTLHTAQKGALLFLKKVILA